MNSSNVKIGTIKIHFKQFAFIENEKIFIEPNNVRDAFDRDLVEYEITSAFDEAHQKYQGRIVSVIKRYKEYFVVEITHVSSRVIGYFDNKKVVDSVQVLEHTKAFEGEKVVIKVTNFNRHKLTGVFIKSLGHKDAPGVDIASVLNELNIPSEFPEDVVAEAEQLVDKIPELKVANTHRDITDKVFYTIDPTDSKDFDDAICVEKYDDGSYDLFVAIADVWSYLKDSPAIEKVALKRNTSLYLMNSVIPMLPFKLSSNLCSLVADMERPVLVARIPIDKGGIIDFEATEIFPAIIKSKKRFTYDQVNQYLENQQQLDATAEVVAAIQSSHDLYQLVDAIRQQKGSLNINKESYKFNLNINNDIEDVYLYKTGTAQKLVEAFMVSANIAVAMYCQKLKIPSIYRNHEKPAAEKIENFITECKELNIYIQINEGTDVNVKLINSWIDKYKSHEHLELMKTLILNNLLKKASYSPVSVYHYGLNEENYLHFTSPIRRSPDLIVHKILYMCVFNKDDYSNESRIKLEKELSILSHNATLSEIRHSDAEGQIARQKIFKYLTQNNRNTFEGVVVSRNKNVSVVKINNIYETFVRTRFQIKLSSKVLIKLIDGTQDFRFLKVL